MTSLSATAWPAQALYEVHSCARGDMENGIKEQLMLFSDRTSTHYLRSNQFTSLRSPACCCRCCGDWDWRERSCSRPGCSSIGLKVLKIGALIRITVRKVWISLAGGYPHVELFGKSMKSCAPSQ